MWNLSESETVAAGESIAITGMACRLPGANDAESLWTLLRGGDSAIGPIPNTRWDNDAVYDADRRTPGHTVNHQAGLLDDIALFDAGFFGISAREARAMDPQQRIILEQSWQALEDAGLAPECLRGEQVGVFAATMANDYQQHLASPFRPPDGYAALGNYAALLANRVSSFFGLRGASVTVDSACASSLAALHQARLALLSGSVELCLVAAANAIISPWKSVSFSQAGMLSADGLCKTFDQAANGYVPGEGVVVLVLRRTRDALSAGDRIHGLLLGSALNHSGPSRSITAPSVEAEADVIRAALSAAGVDPAAVSYVETHGTGTALGDPIEVAALSHVLPPERQNGHRPRAHIGSIKTNLGHLEAAAGLAGIAKVLLMFRHGQIPPTLNLECDNPLLDFANLSFEPARALMTWDARPRIAGVSAFGFGGAGAHVVLAEPPAAEQTKGRISFVPAPMTLPIPLLLSANDETALRTIATDYAKLLSESDCPALTDLSLALRNGRGGLRYRLLVSAKTASAAAATLLQPDLNIRVKPANSIRLALRINAMSSVGAADWRALQQAFPGLRKHLQNVQLTLRAGGFCTELPLLDAYCNLRALILLLNDCGLKPDLLSTGGNALLEQAVALAASAMLDEQAAAHLICYDRLETTTLQRPSCWLYDQASAVSLPPLQLPPENIRDLLSAITANSAKDTETNVLELGRHLTEHNHTFRAQLDDWQEALNITGQSVADLLLSRTDSTGLALATAAAIWRTCTRWSLPAPAAARCWPGWPLASLVADDLITKPLALALIGGAASVQDINTMLASVTQYPCLQRHPWLAQQRHHLPELTNLEAPLFASSSVAKQHALPTADVTLTLGTTAETLQNTQHIACDPAAGPDALVIALAQLWHSGIDIQWRKLEQPWPRLDLPLYPFTRQPYWLSRLPEGNHAELWETKQSVTLSEKSAGTPTLHRVPVVPMTPQPGTTKNGQDQTDLLDQIRSCVAETIEASPADIDPERPLAQQGIDSLVAMDLITRIERSTGVRLNPAVIYEYGTVVALTARVAQQLDASRKPVVSAANKAAYPKLTQADCHQRLHITTTGLLDTITVQSQPHEEPGPGQVLIEVHAAGLNFRDVMIALGALDQAQHDPLGLEFCGEVLAVGAEVSHVPIGTRVFGIGFGALSERLITSADLICPAPDSLTDAQSAALPIGYLTALRCLEQIAGLKQGQTVLIHCASGGFGQAAIQISRACGASILATAGSPEKRSWLADQGITQVMDSRSLTFSKQALEATNGHGVDLVLNVLSGAAIDHGLDCLAPGGTFIELGKTDIRTPAEVAQQRTDIHYIAYDLVTEIRNQTTMIGALLADLANRIERGDLAALPLETYALSDAQAAFRQMARARHLGKIVLLTKTPTPATPLLLKRTSAAEEVPLAIVGMSGCFPGAADCDALWTLLATGGSGIGEVPPGRWSERDLELFASNTTDLGRLSKGGFLADADCFDNQFFGLSPREAKVCDPRQRLLLEQTWLALHDAGLEWNGPGTSLRKQNLGVFIACDGADYNFKRSTAGVSSDPLALAGMLPSSLAARLAHVFDFDGPALTIDMACTSSLGAMWAAQRALLQGDCRSAVIGAVSVHATPMLAAQLDAAKLLSPQGRCLPFTTAADGLLPAEACIALVVKSLPSARADGDLIHAVIRTVGIGHDGSDSSFTNPSAATQTRLHKETLSRAGLEVAAIDLIAAHGVGSPSGDAGELAALADTFVDIVKALPLTTVKPALGHTLAAAGLTATVHTILQLRRQQLLPVAIPHASALPELAATPFQIPVTITPWPARRDGQPRRVLLNAFAINGANGVAILEEAPVDLARPAEPLVRKPDRILKRRRFWPEQEDKPLPVAHASRTAAALRDEIADLLQESPAAIDLNQQPLDIGLESILAIELQHRLQRRFGVAITLEHILAARPLNDLVPLLQRAATSTMAKLSVTTDEQPTAPFPLTDLQAAYWMGRNPDLPLGGSDCQVYWEFECARPWPVENLESAWNQLVSVHPMLRAIIDPDGQQRVQAAVAQYRLEVADLRDLPAPRVKQQREQLRHLLSTATIDPSTWPLFRIAVSISADSQRLHCVLNLMLVDVLSLYALLDQLASLASDPAAALAAPSISFRQCVLAMQHQDDDSKRQAQQFWRERGPLLPPAPLLPTITGTPERLQTQRFQMRLPGARWQAIAEQARKHGLSTSTTILAAFAVVIAHWSQQSQFTLNLTTHARPALGPDSKRVIGNFTSTLLLDIDAATTNPFLNFSQRINQRLLEHLEHAHYPGVRVLRQRAAEQGWQAGMMPVVFTSMLGYDALRESNQTQASKATRIGRLLHGATRTPQVSLDAQVQADADGLLLSWDVAEGVFPEHLPATMFQAWTLAVTTLAENNGWHSDMAAGIAALEAEARAKSNSAIAALPNQALFEPFLRQAAAHPQNMAILAPDRHLDYATLAGLCSDLTAELQTIGIRSGELVAVAMERGWRQVVAVIAIQQAGAAYLPLAPDLPPARFTRLAALGEVRIGITEQGRTLAWSSTTQVVEIDADAQPRQAPFQAIEPDPDRLAYVIFTSGSTGEPKGVMLSHRAALNTCLDINQRFDINAQDRVLALSALNFDLSVWDIFGTLAAGAALVMPAPASANDPAHLAQLMTTHKVTFWNSVPMYLELFLAADPAVESVVCLRTVMLSGDWIPLSLPERLRSLAPQAQVDSLGGATEAAIWSIHYPLEPSPRPGWPSVPYGRALANQTMHILDEALQPCADFVSGELYIGGAGLALGYWRDPVRTAAAFINHPDTGERLYRTGDYARWREDGLIEFQGRRDGQVKIDGHRLELGEIESTLRTHANVRDVIVIAPTDANGRRWLAAFCVLEADTPVDTLVGYLRQRLPPYMTPRQLHVLDGFPLSDNNKVDRRALMALATSVNPVIAETATITNPNQAHEHRAMTEKLLALWAELLADAHVSIELDAQRNLFELGADSMTAVVASRRISREWGIACSVTEIFEHATISRLAHLLASRATPTAKNVVLPLAVAKTAAPNLYEIQRDRRRRFRANLG